MREFVADRGWKMVWSSPDAGDASGDLVDRVLAARGVSDAGAFLDPSLMDLHDPGLLPGIDRAAERLLGAARAGEPIVVYGDYDVDGITASAILLRMLRALEPGARVSSYVPHRVDEGYGLHGAALRSLAQDGARVVVSVDCGITAAGPAAEAREAGLDLIITDHHNLPSEDAGEESGGGELPGAFALVHPRLDDQDGSACYPWGELCGAGVAYKLAWRLATMHAGSDRVAERIRPVLLDLLALAALGTVADVVPLVDENRVITRFGLRRCRTTGVVGLTALIEAAGLSGGDIDSESVGFRLGPMLNASGRLGHASVAVELLTTDDRRRADEIARGLVALNEERKATQQRIFEQAEEMAEAAGMTGDDRRAIVLAHGDWHPGVVGIVCSRLVERHARPVILMQRQEDGDGVLCCGSGRSIDGFNLHGAVGACGDLLEGFGGHDMAIGLRVRGERFDAFVERFIESVNGALGPDDLVRRARYDCEATLEELTPASVKRLSMLSPFGRANPPVRLCVRGLRVDGRAEPFGKRGDHLGVRLRCPRSGRGVRAVGWRWGEMVERFRPGAVVDALLEPKVSDWSGQVEPVLVDVRGVGVADAVVR